MIFSRQAARRGQDCPTAVPHPLVCRPFAALSGLCNRPVRDALNETSSGVRFGDRMKIALLIVGTLLLIFLVPFIFLAL